MASDNNCGTKILNNKSKTVTALKTAASSNDNCSTSFLQERWTAKIPVKENDLPLEILTKAKKSKLPSAVYKGVHQYAVTQGRDTYIDPASGYSVFTTTYLKQKSCCGNGC